MKSFAIVVLLFFSFNLVRAQDSLIVCNEPVYKNYFDFEELDEVVYERIFCLDVVSKLPEFPGGYDALIEYIQNNIWYPKGREDVKGTVYIKAVIDKRGYVANTEIIRGIDSVFDRIATHTVKQLPRFKPAELYGIPVNVYFIFPVRFEGKKKPSKK